MTEPNDRELERYLQGEGALSRRYREASRETAPPELDAAILAQARADVRRRRPRASPWLASLALAASVVLAVNLGWNVQQSGPAPADEPHLALSRERVPAPAAPAPEAKAEADAPMRQELEEAQAARAQEQLRNAMALKKHEAESARAAPRAALSFDQITASPASLDEAQKIDRLIRFVAGLRDARFVRHGESYDAAEAAGTLRREREKAGARVRTAEDFIRLCVSHASLSDQAYLIRYPDGVTRTAEEVLREELARIEGR